MGLGATDGIDAGAVANAKTGRQIARWQGLRKIAPEDDAFWCGFRVTQTTKCRDAILIAVIDAHV